MRRGLKTPWRISRSSDVHLAAANCLYISGFWWLRPQNPNEAPPLDFAVPQIPCAHPDFRDWLRHCLHMSEEAITASAT